MEYNIEKLITKKYLRMRGVITGSTFTIILPDETLREEHQEKAMVDVLDNHLIQKARVELSDIYL